MAAVPITFRGTMYPKDKSVKPYAFTAVGMANITGFEVGGGPIIPPDEIDEVPKPPGDWVIWPPPGPLPGIEHPIVIPPDLPPTEPPSTPQAPHEGWNWSAAKSGWYYLYVPGEGDSGPKGSRPKG